MIMMMTMMILRINTFFQNKKVEKGGVPLFSLSISQDFFFFLKDDENDDDGFGRRICNFLFVFSVAAANALCSFCTVEVEEKRDVLFLFFV